LLLLSVIVFREELDSPSPSSADGDVIPGRYIVLLEPGTDRSWAARDLGVDVRAFYRSAVNGFSAEMTADRAAQVARAPTVALVEPVRRLGIALHQNNFQTLVEGIDRIDGEENATAGIGLPAGPEVDADIAVIDTGIDLDHPDLNAIAGFGAYEARLPDNPDGSPAYGDCNTASDPEDEHGHGTHVAGTAAAIDNGIGVVGTAPGARVWAVRVLRDDGFGCDDDVLRGIDWVTERKIEFDDGAEDGDPGVNFTVANMSLGGEPSPALCAGIANSVAQGVMYAVAAGNHAADASTSGPADCADVVTVSAFADYDGQAGGLADRTCSWTGLSQPDPDDSFAWFSNFGPLVEIAAPGVCIMSTYPSDDPPGLYATMSGTSMATPHVAGALALFKASTGYAGPHGGASVMAALTAAGWTRAQNSECGFSDDPDGSPEPVLYMGTSCSTATLTPSPTPSPSPSPTPTASPSPTAVPTPTASPSPTPTPTPSASPAPSPSPSPEPLDPADIDCNHAITGSDSLIILLFAANVDTPSAPDCPPVGALSGAVAARSPAQLRGDLDCSGAVNVKDALVILRLLGGVAGPTETPCAS
jgi:subtilisin family serine protease